jgi:hydroxyacylglutathione hydrolase
MGRPVIDFHSLAFEKKDYGDGIYAFTAPMKEQIYLVLGQEKAMVIDNGMGIGSVLTEIRKVTKLPLVMVATHGHPDHAGGNAEFEKCYLNMEDLPVYRIMVKKEYRAADVTRLFGDNGHYFIDHLLPYVENLVPYKEGDVFDLGGRRLTAYQVRGHTLGSMVLYDENTKTLFGGDAFTIRETWLYLWYSTTVKEYYEALKHLKEQRLDIKRIFGGHIPNEDNATLIDRKLALLKGIMDGTIVGAPFQTFAGKGLLAEGDGTSIVYDPNRLK